MSWIAISCFFLIIGITLVITYFAARQTKSAADFYVAGGRISGTQNGLAIAGDFVSAATLLGTTAMIYSAGFDAAIYQCGIITLLGGKINNFSTRSIEVLLRNLPAHFSIRVMVNYYFYNANGTSKNAIITVGSNSNNNATVSGPDSSYSFHQCSSSDPNSYVYRHIDASIPHSAVKGTNVNVYFNTNVNVHYGIRDVIIIVKKCHSNCATCSGYLEN